jgi:hypothetical protein
VIGGAAAQDLNGHVLKASSGGDIAPATVCINIVRLAANQREDSVNGRFRQGFGLQRYAQLVRRGRDVYKESGAQQSGKSLASSSTSMVVRQG